MPRRPALTGVRGIAALAVCGTHAAYWTGHYTPDTVGRLAARLEIGVAVFFVLSGYLLFRPWAVHLLDPTQPRPALRRYAWHRLLRVGPAYWIVVPLVFAVYLWWYDDASPPPSNSQSFWRNITFTQVYGLGYLHSGLTQLWSMCSEVAYYLALPLLGGFLFVLVKLLPRHRGWALTGGLLVLAAVSPVWAVIAHGATADPTARLWPPAFFLWFVGGCALAAVAQRLTVEIPATLSFLSGLLAFLLACGSWAGEPTITPTSLAATNTKLLLYLLAAVAWLAPLALNNPGTSWFDRALAAPAVVWFGTISYEFFLLHVVVIDLAMHWLGYGIFQGSMLGIFATALVVTTPLAWALRRGIGYVTRDTLTR